MRFSWTGLILAPLLGPLLLSTTFVDDFESGGPLLGALIVLEGACIISYGTTILLFLPSLFLLSRWRRMTGFRVCLLGLVLGVVAYVPVMMMFCSGSGSRLPTESLFAGCASDDPFTVIFPVVGLMTAGTYWWLGTWRRGRSIPARQ